MIRVFTRVSKIFLWLGFSRRQGKLFKFFSIFFLNPNFYFSNQIVYEAPKTDDQNEIRFVKLEDEEYNLIRNKMLRNITPKLSSGHSWMSRDCPRPFSEI